MDRWHRPPAEIPTAEFFETWLPAAYAAERPPTGGGPVVRATLSGPGGGAWDIEPEDDALHVTPAGGGAPDVWVRQANADFRAVLDGHPDLPALVPPNWSMLDLLFLDPRDGELLRQIDGRVLVEVTGRRGRRWSFDAAFGKTGVTAGRARTTVRVDGATFEGMQSGRIPPMQPLLDGRLSLEGDRTFAMQVLLLLGSRLGRR